METNHETTESVQAPTMSPDPFGKRIRHRQADDAGWPWERGNYRWDATRGKKKWGVGAGEHEPQMGRETRMDTNENESRETDFTDGHGFKRRDAREWKPQMDADGHR